MEGRLNLMSLGEVETILHKRFCDGLVDYQQFSIEKLSEMYDLFKKMVDERVGMKDIDNYRKI